ncbi:MAG: hypothetical protein HY517_03005 [Candidatus Aenigmarchaeota archaeon]|nr:hypothetical protein [Candidatus Aenigmarchaeota archaeon]
MTSAAAYNSWLNGLKREGQIPGWMPVYFSEGMSEDAMGKIATELFRSIMDAYNKRPKTRKMHMYTPYFQGGNLYYIDRLDNNNVVFSSVVQPNGYKSWTIDDDGTVMWGGRGQMRGMLDADEDGDFHRDLYKSR